MDRIAFGDKFAMSPSFRNLSWTATLAALSLCTISIRASDEKPPVTGQPPQVDAPDKGQADEAEFDLQGKWLGEINLVSHKLRLGFVIDPRTDNAWTGKLYSIDQGNMEVPLSEIKRDGKNISFVVKSIAGRFDGQWYPDSGKLAGFWKQGLVPLPLTLKRVEQLPALRRPQNPQPPYPYVETEISFKNGVHQISLNGTLTLPQGPGPFPAAVLISGSGPQDRNETLFGHRPFLVLADALTRRGIAVLRFDDRDFGKPQEVFKATSAELSEDAAAAIDFLKTRAEIDPEKIGLIGHSEGGMIAPMLAARRQEIAFMVMIAGPGIIGEEVLHGQRDRIKQLAGIKAEPIEKERNILMKMYAVVRSQPDDKVALEELKKIAEEEWPKEGKQQVQREVAVLIQQTRMMVTPWFRYFLTYDPVPDLKQVKCPVLAINGEQDCQVLPKENLPAIEAALKAGQNADFTVQELKGLNHLLQPCTTGLPQEYGSIETTIDPAALTLIGDWIAKRMLK